VGPKRSDLTGAVVARILLIDTDVLVDYLREFPPAVEYLEALEEDLCTSSIVVAELYGGVREGKERQALESLLSVFEIKPIEADLAERAGLLRRDYARKHSTGLAHALIAATAQQSGADLVTLNAKHFPMLQNVIVPYKK
jgi:predicted nucleic acid-binding protein